ncbi:MAG: LysM domain-containing protein [Clostridiales bacterium]
MNSNYSINNFENNNKYKIKEGDTPYKIAKYFKISLDELVKWNPTINPIALNEGDFIIIHE